MSIIQTNGPVNEGMEDDGPPTALIVPPHVVSSFRKELDQAAEMGPNNWDMVIGICSNQLQKIENLESLPTPELRTLEKEFKALRDYAEAARKIPGSQVKLRMIKEEVTTAQRALLESILTFTDEQSPLFALPERVKAKIGEEVTAKISETAIRMGDQAEKILQTLS